MLVAAGETVFQKGEGWSCTFPKTDTAVTARYRMEKFPYEK
jgi:hypothetical protein